MDNIEKNKMGLCSTIWCNKNFLTIVNYKSQNDIICNLVKVCFYQKLGSCKKFKRHNLS